MNQAEISLELRATAPRAPEALRQRVAAIATVEPEPRGRLLRLPVAPSRRAAFALAAAFALLVGSALVAGIVRSGSGSKRATDNFMSSKDLPGPVSNGASAPALEKRARAAAGAAAAAKAAGLGQFPPSTRLQDYQVSLRVRVKDQDALSKATVDAMRWTRSAGGYVARVSYDTPGARTGDSYLVLRVPVGKVQAAIQQLSGLGTLESQHVSVTDLQDQVNAQTKRIIVLSRRIEAIAKRLAAGGLSVDAEARLRAELDARRAELRAVTQAKSATVRRGRLSRVELELTTRKQSVVAPPAKPGRVGGALHDAGRILAAEAAYLLLALIVVGPFLLVGVAAWRAARAGRRRASERLLARS